ncbi:MAG TPA: quinolinate synthase NadA [Fibrobacteraceae bacterium]|nr:quinolinate synthase NadA [Fibrobacteraceae bacterium]
MNGDQLYRKLGGIPAQLALGLYTPETCEIMASQLAEIERLKRERNAVILGHYYVPREITLAAADYVGDSYALSLDASRTRADVIVFAAVRFMAETAKILNPTKTVLVPGSDPACSLADAITADQVRALRAQYPEHTFVCYINTTAEVKAECDVCVTSSNVVNICAAIPNDRIVFVPDRLMGQNVIDFLHARGIQKEIVVFREGACHVHERFDPGMVRLFRERIPGVQVLAHPECHPEVIRQAHFVGSTNQIEAHIKTYSEPQTLLILTECGLVSSLLEQFPQHRFVGSCQMCQYMKSNSLEGILRVLKSPRPEDEIHLDPQIMARARKCIDAMFIYAGQRK